MNTPQHTPQSYKELLAESLGVNRYGGTKKQNAINQYEKIVALIESEKQSALHSYADAVEREVIGENQRTSGGFNNAVLDDTVNELKYKQRTAHAKLRNQFGIGE